VSFPRKTFAFALALVSILAGSVAAQKPPPRDITRDERLIGTVVAIDPKAMTFDLLTGVGYALRIRRIHLTAQTDFTSQRAEVTFSRLAAGSIVRVEGKTTGGVTTASKTEILQPAPGAGKP